MDGISDAQSMFRQSLKMSSGMARSVRSVLGQAVRAVPRPVWATIYPAVAFVVAPSGHYEGHEYADRASAFAWIYRENRWRSAESRSGVGSTLAYTRTLRDDLAAVLKDLRATSLLDAPCGDFNWMRHVRLPEGCVYRGRDIVAELIESLRTQFPSLDWDVLDIVNGTLPPSDVWLCRDVLFHLPLADGQAVLRNMAASQVGYFLSKTYDFVRRNEDVRAGGFRYINLRAAPFNLPPPIRRIADFHVPGPPGYLDLWSRDQVLRAVGSARD